MYKIKNICTVQIIKNTLIIKAKTEVLYDFKWKKISVRNRRTTKGASGGVIASTRCCAKTSCYYYRQFPSKHNVCKYEG